MKITYLPEHITYDPGTILTYEELLDLPDGVEFSIKTRFSRQFDTLFKYWKEGTRIHWIRISNPEMCGSNKGWLEHPDAKESRYMIL